MNATRRLAIALIMISAAAARAESGGAIDSSQSSNEPSLVDFQRDVGPILQEKCIACHGQSMQLADLRLDEKQRAFEGGESGGPIDQGNSDGSYLIERLVNRDQGLIMPPTGKLPEKEVATLRKWIDQGAAWPDDLRLAPQQDAKEENPKFKALFSAIRRADASAVEKILDNAPGLIPMQDRHGSTPLMYASLYAKRDCVELLLDRGGDPNHVNHSGATALMWAARDLEKVELLLAHQADPNARSRFGGRTPVMIASTFAGNVKVVKTLLAAIADHPTAGDQKDGALPLAAWTGDLAIVRTLLDSGADVNMDQDPIRIAAFIDNPPMVQLLLRNGASGPANNAALIDAAMNGSLTTVQSLLDTGADVNAQVNSRSRPANALAAAVYSDYQDQDVVRLLLEHGADPTIRDSRDRTAFQYATRRARTEMVDLMARREARGQRSVREAAQKGLALLQSCGTTFYRRSGCVACHHHTVASLAIEQARRTGVPYDESAAQEHLKITALVKADRRPRFLQRIKTGGAGHTTGYLLWGMGAEGYPADEITDASAIELSGLQMADGSWFSYAHRPPTEYSDISATAVSVRGMQLYAPPGLQAGFERQYERARQWLIKAKADSNQECAFRLLGLRWTGADDNAIERAKADLLKQQHADGGWSQLPGMDTDAYATGLALYALHAGGGLPCSDSAYSRGMQFLLTRQLDDGSWHVHSRSYRLQPYFESGFPHHHDQWISAAATGWAATALMFSLESQQTVETTAYRHDGL